MGGDPRAFDLPRPLLNQPGCDMSFSGLKTAMLRARDAVVAAKGGLTRQDQTDLSASFQAAIADVLVEKTRRALAIYLAIKPVTPCFAIAGGVAANQVIRGRLMQLCASLDTDFVAPPLALCTDNAAMIAYVGAELLAFGQRDDLTLSARPRWPLDKTAAPMLGSGKKGAKA
jgi:N6-L-threonylcarbamoyladenine synthase